MRNFRHRQGAPQKARRRRSYLRQAAFEEQRRMRKNQSQNSAMQRSYAATGSSAAVIGLPTTI